jgi:hypothetical protein
MNAIVLTIMMSLVIPKLSSGTPTKGQYCVITIDTKNPDTNAPIRNLASNQSTPLFFSEEKNKSSEHYTLSCFSVARTECDVTESHNYKSDCR